MYSWPQNYYPVQNLFFQPQISILTEYWLRIYCVSAWIYVCTLSRSVVSDSLWPHGLLPTRLFWSWDFPGKNTGMGHHSLLQRIFAIQESNPSPLHCRWIFYYLSHQGSPNVYAKSLQSCPTLCNPIDGGPPGSLSLGFSRQEHWSGLPFPSPVHEREKWKWSHSVVSDSSWPHGLQPTRLLRPWDFPGKSTGVGCHCLLHKCI